MSTNLIKVSEHKVNIKKSVTFLDANNKLWEGEIKQTIPFTIASKIKHLEINVTKEVKYLYTEHYKTLVKEVEDNK